jgi:transcriptional regulator with XRE-family HTH domain
MPRNTDPELTKRIATRVRELREARGLSQEALAERTELAVETISRTERGTLLPSLGTLRALARGLELPMKDLLEEGEERSLPGLLLSEEEREVVQRLRRLPAEARFGLVHLLRAVTP